jgi:hypothetical protein
MEADADHGRPGREDLDRRTGQRPDQPRQRTDRAVQLDATGREVSLQARLRADPLDPHHADHLPRRIPGGLVHRSAHTVHGRCHVPIRGLKAGSGAVEAI